MNIEKIERYIAEFYKDYSRLRFDKWRYEDGCVLLAAEQLCAATGSSSFRDYILGYADRYISASGEIESYRPEEYKLDDILPGRALIFAYSETGEERYKLAVERLLEQLKNQPRTLSGSYWHKKIYPNQVWLDGLFMAQPFRMSCDTRYSDRGNYPDICRQFALVRENMRDPATGLYYHGFDESRTAFWADPETGLSKNFWLRAEGWYLMALVETVGEMDRSLYEFRRSLQDIYREALSALLKYADPETGLLYQVINRPDAECNYLETSGSAMVAASVFKACRLKMVSEERYIPAAEKILNSLIDLRISEVGGKPVLEGTCSVAGLGPDPGRRYGTLEYYLSEPVAVDDNKGAAALFAAYAQYLLYLKFRDGVRRSKD